jgi:hypothetical protein
VFSPKAGPVLSIGETFGRYLVDFILPGLIWFKFEKGNGSMYRILDVFA